VKRLIFWIVLFLLAFSLKGLFGSLAMPAEICTNCPPGGT
jgi:hypothetical protein